jgi:hypothetical protein
VDFFYDYENRRDRCYDMFPTLLNPKRKHPEREKSPVKGCQSQAAI